MVPATSRSVETQKRAEPKRLSRGELARAILYVSDRHGVPLCLPEAKLLEWHRSDRSEPWECMRADLIRERTGLIQHYVEMTCSGSGR